MSPKSASSTPRDVGPGVQFPPPLLFATAFALGAALRAVWPIGATVLERQWVEVLGVLLAVLGFGLVFIGIVTFRRARVSVYPNRPARSVVTHGVYAYTRNPMYTGLTAAYIGGALIIASVWPFVLLPIVMWLLTTLVIRKEEAHLHERFPAEYGAYCAQVRRWL